jgi:hypothetical protein
LLASVQNPSNNVRMNTRKVQLTCECGLSLGPSGSVERISGAGKEKVRRYICANGHRNNAIRLKEIYEDWVKFLAFRLQEQGTLTLREIAVELETYIAKTGIGRELGKQRFAHTTIRYWFKNGVANVIGKSEKTRRVIESLPHFEQWDKGLPLRAKFRNSFLEIEKISESRDYKDALTKWVNANPEVRTLMKSHASVARGLIRPRHLLFEAWAVLENNPQRVKHIQAELDRLDKEAFQGAKESNDSPRLKAARQRLQELWRKAQSGVIPTELLDKGSEFQQAYFGELSQQLNDAIIGIYPRFSGKLKFKNGHIYQQLYNELEYGPE